MIPEVFGAALMVWGSILYVTGLIVWAAASLNRADESSKEQLRSFFEATAVGMAQSDPEGRLLRINNAYGRITGYSQEELSGRSLPDLTHPDEREADLARFRMMANGETPVYDVEKRCVRKDGAIIWCHATAAAVRDPGGRAVTIAVAMEDITERKSTEQALRQSEQRFAQFMQYLPGLAWIKDLQGRYMYANDAAEMAFHTSRAQLYGKTDDEIFPPEIASQFRENDRRALASGTGEQVIETLKHGNGVLHYSLVSKFTIPGPDGEAALVGGVAIDITELKRAEKALRESDRRKDQFLAMLAHELRNPLAALDSSLVLLADTHYAGDRDWAMKISMRQVRHLVRMVDDLLDTSRITRGTIRLQTELVQPAEVIGRAIEAMRHLAEAKGHQLCVSMAPHLPKLEADPTRLEQIISNLLTNAIKFTQPGGRVEVSVQVEGSTLVLTVRDTGAGIAPEFLPHIFELFAQSDTSLSREHGGLGLGLTLVKALIEQHGGSVEARSEGLGRGSEFVVRLPTFNGDAVIVPENGSIKKPLDACRKSGPVRILMVEDNLEYARCLGRLLEATGYEIRISCDGPTALDEAHLWIPDVFLLDLGLPGMDGFEVARRIHEDASFARAKVVVVSGYAGEEEHRRSEEIGIDAHLAKPVVLRDLLRTISDEDRASLA